MRGRNEQAGVRSEGEAGQNGTCPGHVSPCLTGKPASGRDGPGQGAIALSRCPAPDAPLTTAPITVYRTGPSGGFTGRGARSPGFSPLGKNYGFPKTVFPQTVNRNRESVT